MGFSLLLRRISSRRLQSDGRGFLPLHLYPKRFSSFQTAATSVNSSDSPAKPTSLSSRLSFVFDQIDAIERERSQKDETLQRIRSWRESKKAKEAASAMSISSNELSNGDAAEPVQANFDEHELRGEEKSLNGLVGKSELELVHPWPEWIELMERLVQQNYFDHRRKDEDRMIEDLGFKMSDVADEGFDFTRDWKTVQTAVLNFGRDRFDILKSLSRQVIQILVGHGCPSADKKVAFSAKLLRKHVHLDEGDVCSSCSLRSSCEKAYLLTNKEDEARTIDVMRILLTYGFEPVNGSVVNKSILKIKSVRTVVRKLLHEVVRLSAVPIDPNLPPPIIKKPPPKVKQPPPPPKKRVGRDDIEMKKGDWLCSKCDFMNFAKNTVCLQCDANRPKRQLLPGEWECPQCNFLNYRRNVVCFHCEHKRPPDEYTESQMRERQHGLRTTPEKISNRGDIPNAWNFDFDDDESDGADVAAFEYADSQKLDEDFPLHSGAGGETKPPRMHETENANHAAETPGIGFDDFDDEDDIDSYELDAPNNKKVQRRSSVDFSDLEDDSKPEEIGPTRNNKAFHRPAKRMRGRPAFSEDDELELESDEELPVRHNRNSNKFSGYRQQKRGGRGAITHGSDDDDFGFSSDAEDLEDGDSHVRQSKGYGIWPSRDPARRTRGSEGNSFNDKFRRSNRGSPNRERMNNRDSERNSFSDKFSRSNKVSPNRERMSNRDSERNSFSDKFSRSNRESPNRERMGNRGSERNSFSDKFSRSNRGSPSRERMNNRSSERNSFSDFRHRSSHGRQDRTSNNFDNRSDRYLDDERYKRPRVNVR